MARFVYFVFGVILVNSFGAGSSSKLNSKASSSAITSASASGSVSASASATTKILKCGDNEILDKCPVDCPSDYCPKSRDDDQSKCPKPKKCPPAACKCGFNYRRADNKTCIPTKSCPPFKCNGPNEVYNPCPSSCPGEDCSNATADGKCHRRGKRPVVECKPACRCKKNYWRLNGECVSYAQCQREDAMNRLTSANTAVTGKYLYERIVKYPRQSYSLVSLPVLCTVGHLAYFAEGEEYKKIMKVLNLKNKDEIKQVISDAVAKIKSYSDGQTKFAVKVYGDTDEEFTDTFIETLEEECQGESELVDYDCPRKTLRKIKHWFAEESSYGADSLDDEEMFEDHDGVVYTTSLDFVYSLDHEANPNCIKEIDYHVTPNKTLKFPSLYGNGYFKYAELEDLDAKVLIFHLKGDHYGCFIYPNDPDNLVELMRKTQDPKVFNGIIERAEWMCLKVHITIGYAEVTNDLLEFIPELKLKETNFKNVFKSGKPAHVNAIYQQLHLYYNPKTREGPLNSELCPGDDLPFVKMDHPCAYYVMDSKWMVDYAGVLYGPQSYTLES